MLSLLRARVQSPGRGTKIPASCVGMQRVWLTFIQDVLPPFFLLSLIPVTCYYLCKVKNVIVWGLLTWVFSISSEILKFCTWTTREQRNPLSWSIRNLENNYWIILRNVEAIAFGLGCYSLDMMNLEMLVKRLLNFRLWQPSWWELWRYIHVHPYTISICYIHNKLFITVTHFNVSFHFANNVFIVIF